MKNLFPLMFTLVVCCIGCSSVQVEAMKGGKHYRPLDDDYPVHLYVCMDRNLYNPKEQCIELQYIGYFDKKMNFMQRITNLDWKGKEVGKGSYSGDRDFFYPEFEQVYPKARAIGGNAIVIYYEGDVRADRNIATDYKYTGDRIVAGKTFREYKSTRTIEKGSKIGLYYWFAVVRLPQFLPKTIDGDVKKYNLFFDIQAAKSKDPINCREEDRASDNRIVLNGFITVYGCSGGRVDGPSTTFYPDGKKIKSQRAYRDGRPSGFFVNYHENGRVEERYEITGEKFSDVVERYDEKAILVSKTFYAKEGYVVKQVYYKDGRMVTGLPDLKHRVEVVRCKGEDRDGENRHPYGSSSITFSCKNGFRNGTEKIIGSDGKLISISEYREGKLHGTRLTYFQNGKMSSKREYKDGLCQYGEDYGLEGGITRKNFYREGYRTRSEFSPYGILQRKEYYVPAERQPMIGDELSYYTVKIEHFLNGKLVKTENFDIK